MRLESLLRRRNQETDALVTRFGGQMSVVHDRKLASVPPSTAPGRPLSIGGRLYS